MKNKDNIYDFLKSNGFKLIKKEKSDYFGDYCDVLINDNLQLRFSSSKSFETVDIRSNLKAGYWYDWALVKALLYSEQNLNKETSIAEYRLFLMKDLSKLIELFDYKNYLNTKKSLEELKNERVRQMFSAGENKSKI